MVQPPRVSHGRFASVGLFPSRFRLPTPQRAIRPRDRFAKKNRYACDFFGAEVSVFQEDTFFKSIRFRVFCEFVERRCRGVRHEPCGTILNKYRVKRMAWFYVNPIMVSLGSFVVLLPRNNDLSMDRDGIMPLIRPECLT